MPSSRRWQLDLTFCHRLCLLQTYYALAATHAVCSGVEPTSREYDEVTMVQVIDNYLLRSCVDAIPAAARSLTFFVVEASLNPNQQTHESMLTARDLVAVDGTFLLSQLVLSAEVSALPDFRSLAPLSNLTTTCLSDLTGTPGSASPSRRLIDCRPHALGVPSNGLALPVLVLHSSAALLRVLNGLGTNFSTLSYLHIFCVPGAKFVLLLLDLAVTLTLN